MNTTKMVGRFLGQFAVGAGIGASTFIMKNTAALARKLNEPKKNRKQCNCNCHQNGHQPRQGSSS
jgi:hypothetical protein